MKGVNRLHIHSLDDDERGEPLVIEAKKCVGGAVGTRSVPIDRRAEGKERLMG